MVGILLIYINKFKMSTKKEKKAGKKDKEKDKER